MSDISSFLRRAGLTLLASLLPVAALAEAFPGAVGYGKDADGWRGGRVLSVTNTNPEGPGSLRACAEAEGPRVCLVRTAGTIILDRPIKVASNVYIAGQTAPGDGLQIRLDGEGATPIVIKGVNDVLIRFLKVRPGPTDIPHPSVDAVTVENAQHVYLDHMSLSFSTDETFNVHASRGETSHVTLARSLLSYSLDRSSHPEGRHSKGALICSSEKSATGCGRITLWRNLFAHHRDRMPDVNASEIGPVEVVNNLFFNPISQFGEYYNLVGDTRIAHIANVAVPGPSTHDDTPPAVEVFLLHDANPLGLRAEDNLAFGGPCVSNPGPAVLGPTARSRIDLDVPLSEGLPILPAAQVMDALLPMVGDILHRDALDIRALDGLINCSGRVIDRVEQVGGWPVLASAVPEPDTDGDGMPDAWEATHPSLSGESYDDAWAADPDTGLSFLETYLSTLAGDLPEAR
jgi:pectate lyase